MPEAEPFSILGHFPVDEVDPQCFAKNKDVSSFDYWTTLSGFTKDDADAGTRVTQKQIGDSLNNATKLYWYAYGMNYTSETNAGGVLNNSLNADTAPFKWGYEEPFRRICKIDFFEFDYTPGYGVRFMDGAGFNEPTGISIHSLEEFGIGEDQFPIVRMYNGDTTDEDNFVGYGLGRVYSAMVVAGPGFLPIYGYRAFTMESDGGNYCQALVALISHTFDESAFRDVDYAYVELNGVHFLCVANGFATGTGSSVTLDASILSASAQVPANSPDDAVLSSITIDSIGFYNT